MHPSQACCINTVKPRVKGKVLNKSFPKSGSTSKEKRRIKLLGSD